MSGCPHEQELAATRQSLQAMHGGPGYGTVGRMPSLAQIAEAADFPLRKRRKMEDRRDVIVGIINEIIG